MTTNEPQRNETVEQLLDHHNVDDVEDLPGEVQRTINAFPNASYDEDWLLSK